MDEKKYNLVWGTVALVIGLIILFVVFFHAWDIAENPSKKLDEWAPVEVKGPSAYFSWWSEDTLVDFGDISLKGDGEIKSWLWEFGDDTTSTKENPSHEYSNYGNYTVTLIVSDNNGKTDTAKTRVTVNKESNDGQTAQAMSFDLGLTNMLSRLAITILVVCIHAVLIMIGGRIMLAGCKLLISVPSKSKKKPKDVEPELSSEQKDEGEQKISPQKKTKKSWFKKK